MFLPPRTEHLKVSWTPMPHGDLQPSPLIGLRSLPDRAFNSQDAQLNPVFALLSSLNLDLLRSSSTRTPRLERGPPGASQRTEVITEEERGFHFISEAGFDSGNVQWVSSRHCDETQARRNRCSSETDRVRRGFTSLWTEDWNLTMSSCLWEESADLRMKAAWGRNTHWCPHYTQAGAAGFWVKALENLNVKWILLSKWKTALLKRRTGDRLKTFGLRLLPAKSQQQPQGSTHSRWFSPSCRFTALKRPCCPRQRRRSEASPPTCDASAQVKSAPSTCFTFELHVDFILYEKSLKSEQEINGK